MHRLEKSDLALEPPGIALHGVVYALVVSAPKGGGGRQHFFEINTQLLE